jgi:hypothetical protein
MRLSLFSASILTAMMSLGFGTFTTMAEAQASGGIGQTVAGVRINLGMSESEVRTSWENTEYRMRTVRAHPSLRMIVSRSDSTRVVGSISIVDGRVVLIGSDWTPQIDSQAAIGEVIVTLLGRLTTERNADGTREVSHCTVWTAEGVTAGTDEQGRMASILCGPHRVDISLFRIVGGPSTLSVQFVTQ